MKVVTINHGQLTFEYAAAAVESQQLIKMEASHMAHTLWTLKSEIAFIHHPPL